MNTNPTAFSEQLFEYRSVEKRKLILSLSITLVVMAVEVIGGVITHSMALISDAGHMFTHCFAIGISLVAIFIARKPSCHHRTFGLYRAEILAAFINGLFLIVVVVVIVYEAMLRIVHPEEVLAHQMFIVAMMGLSVNVASIYILHGSHKDDLNVKSVFFHMMADAVSSIAIVLSAVIIGCTGWDMLDPIVSLGISAVIAYWAQGILRESTKILLEMAPTGLNIDIISDELKSNFREIHELTHVHLWAITSDMFVFSAHLTPNPSTTVEGSNKIVQSIDEYLRRNYRIIETTIQVEDEATEPDYAGSG